MLRIERRSKVKRIFGRTATPIHHVHAFLRAVVQTDPAEGIELAFVEPSRRTVARVSVFGPVQGRVKYDMGVTISWTRKSIVVDRKFDTSSEQSCGEKYKCCENNRQSQGRCPP
jgi:hypothetical protein